MGTLRTVTRNVASNATGYLVSLVLAFVVTPIAVKSLGDEMYGIWLLIVSLTGYYGILDLGIRSAVSQYITRHWSRGDRVGLARVMSTALAITSGIAAVLIVLSLLLATFGDRLFAVEGDAATEMAAAVLIFGVGVAVSFPMAVFGSAIQARERFDLANIIGIGERLVTNALYVWALQAGHGIVALAWITTGTAMVAHVARVLVARSLLPGISVSPSQVTRAAARSLFGFGAFSFVVSISDRLILYTDTVVIQIALGSVAVTYYSFGSTFIHHFLGLISTVAWTLTPRATAFDELENREALRRLWLIGSRVIMQLATIIAGGLVFLGHEFLALWVGDSYLLGQPFDSSATILAVLAIAALLRAGMSCGRQVLFGMHEVRFLARLSVGEALANIVLSIVGVLWLGNLGVAIGTLIPAVVVNLWLKPRFLAERLEMSVSTFFYKVVPPAVPVFAVMGLASWGVVAVLPAASWGVFTIDAILVGFAGLVTSWFVGLGDEERDMVRRLMRRTA